MDQVRAALTWLKEQHFWVLTCLATIVAVACWYLAAGALSKQYEDNQKQIAQEFTSQRSLSGQPFHPNEVVNNQQEEEIKALATKVEELWKQHYEEQKDQVLKWPAQLDRNASGASSFLGHVAGKRFGEFIGDRFRERYLNYIKNRFADLPKIIKALEADETRPGGRPAMDFEEGVGGDGEIVQEQDYLVIWEDQLAVKQKLAWNSTPSSLRIWVTQEDLWVYETLLKAIAATNKAAGADRYTNAAVRNIYQFQVGAEAATGSKTAQRLYRPEGEGGMGGGGGEFGGEFGGDDFGGGGDFGGGDFGGGEFDGEFGGGELGEGGNNETQELLAGRYVNEAGDPLPAPAAAEGEPLSFGSSEYKLLPVRLALKMDQRWLYQLIVELGNAPLQVEVEEVRINPVDADMGGGGGGEFGSGGGGMRGQRLRALELATRGGSNTTFDGGFGGGGAAAEVGAFPREPYVGDVIIRGIVTIFNPPDPQVLSTGGDDGGFASSDF